VRSRKVAPARVLSCDFVMTSKPERYLIVIFTLLISAVAIPAMIEWWRGVPKQEVSISTRAM